jgi:hypothetical protein
MCQVSESGIPITGKGFYAVKVHIVIIITLSDLKRVTEIV